MTDDSNLHRISLAVRDLSVSREIVLAESVGDAVYVLRSIPAFAYGVGYADEIRLMDAERGLFEIRSRGGNVTIRVFLDGTLDRPEIDALIDAVSQLGGLHEVGKNASSSNDPSLLLLSIPASQGFPRIEDLMRRLDQTGARWEYGNVYDDQGRPLNWW